MPFKTFDEYKVLFDKRKDLAGHEAINAFMTRDLFKFFTDEEYEIFIKNLGDSSKKLADLTYFYFHLTRPDLKDEALVRDELKLIAITSIIESMMNYSNGGHVNFKEWKNRSILNKEKSEYDKIYGSKNIFKYFFDTYLTTCEKSELIETIKEHSETESKPFDKIEKLADMLYEMRCEFVHNAQMTHFVTEEYAFGGFIIKEKGYTSTLSIDKLLQLFERGFTKYWKIKADEGI